MSIWNICGISLTLAFCGMIVKESGARFFPFVGIFGGIFLLSLAFSRYAQPLFYIYNLADGAGVSEYTTLVFKVLAIGYAVTLTSDVCRDMGEVRIASGIETLGRAEILLLCLPVVSEIVETALSFIGQ